jgi:4-hydroxy-tetrahydrodipicolinate synthase
MAFKGTITALVTPFRDGKVDIGSLKALVDQQISGGVNGLLACGCTGEPATLTWEEKLQVIGTVVDAARGRVPVIAGTGTNSTASTVEATRLISAMGIDGVLVITPYYNKPTDQGQIVHYTAAAEASSKPLMIYNVPGRTGTNMSVETLARLGEHPNIHAVKDAAGDMERVTRLRSISGLLYLSGDDHLALAQTLMGGSGVVSVTSNVIPGPFSRMIALGMEGRSREALELHERFYSLMKALFIETNPCPAKKALELAGVIAAADTREPLVAMRDESVHFLSRTLRELELL